MKEVNIVAILTFLVQQIILMLVTTGILAQVEYGTIRFEFRIQDKKVVHSKPSLEMDIREATNK